MSNLPLEARLHRDYDAIDSKLCSVCGGAKKPFEERICHHCTMRLKIRNGGSLLLMDVLETKPGDGVVEAIERCKSKLK